MQLDALVPLENLPAAQLLHMRSLLLVPAASMYVPAAHVDHASQVAALGVSLNLPDAHALHVRSLVVLPAVATYCPAAQVVFAVHGVAGS